MSNKCMPTIKQRKAFRCTLRLFNILLRLDVIAIDDIVSIPMGLTPIRKYVERNYVDKNNE